MFCTRTVQKENMYSNIGGMLGIAKQKLERSDKSLKLCSSMLNCMCSKVVSVHILAHSSMRTQRPQYNANSFHLIPGTYPNTSIEMACV